MALLFPLVPLGLASLACKTTQAVPETTSAPSQCTEGPPAIEVGTGEQAFETIEEGTEIPVIHGPQGGNHMLGSVRVWNMDPIVNIHFTVTRLSDGVVFSDNNYRLLLLEEATCQYYYPGLYGYVGFTGESQDPKYDLGQIIQLEAEMWMEVTDQYGVTAEDGVVVVPSPFEEPSDTAAREPPGG